MFSGVAVGAVDSLNCYDYNKRKDMWQEHGSDCFVSQIVVFPMQSISVIHVLQQ